MKKSLLLLSFAACASIASAQVVVFPTEENQTALGLTKDGVALTDEFVAEHPLVTSEVGNFYLAYGGTWKTSNTYDKYSKVTINGGDVIDLPKYGAVGANNPTFVSYQDGAQTGEAVFRIQALKDGWITVFTKISPNKQYVVMENKTGALPYTLGFANAKAVFSYSLPMLTSGDDEGYIDFSVNPDDKYFIAATKQVKNAEGLLGWTDADGKEVWAADKPEGGKAIMEAIEPRQDKPQFPYITAGLESNPGNGTGFLTFNVLKDNEYYVSALGSKCPMGGFIFTDEQPTIKFCATDELPEVTFEPGKEPVAGVESVAVAADENAPIYNMMGVRVSDDAKGILIQNGKKFIRK